MQATSTKKAPEGAKFKNGGINKPKLEPLQFIYKLEKAINQDFINQIKALDFAA